MGLSFYSLIRQYYYGVFYPNTIGVKRLSLILKSLFSYHLDSYQINDEARVGTLYLLYNCVRKRTEKGENNNFSASITFKQNILHKVSRRTDVETKRSSFVTDKVLSLIKNVFLRNFILPFDGMSNIRTEFVCPFVRPLVCRPA